MLRRLTSPKSASAAVSTGDSYRRSGQWWLDATLPESRLARKTVSVRATPSFLINGKLLEGAQPFEAFQQAIEAALKGK